ncbi:hypothetical protein RB653_000853 [Dictyostelium firmibasis]|uniref:F-box domain-containing protein n=1 Tax=Dictyostelium firmibasis TaxID=79012 RepID=A0AAN7TVX8_9MYCE
MQSPNNASFFTALLKNKYIFGVIASVIVLTLGLFKTIKSSSDGSNDKKNDNKNDNTNENINKRKLQDDILGDLKEEINKLKPLTTNIDSENINTTKTDNNNNINNKNNNNNNKNYKNNNNNNNDIKKDIELISLPHQILYQIFESISPQDFTNCSKLNKKWNSVLIKLDKCWIQYSIDRWNLHQTYPFEETRNKNKEYFKKKYLEEKKRLGFKPEQYIVSIMSECSEFTEPGRWKSEKIINPNGSWWRKRFVEEMSKGLTMTTFILNNNNNSSKNGNGRNNDDDDQEIEDDEEEEVGLDSRCPTGNIVLNGKVNTPIGAFRFIDKEDALLKFNGDSWLEKHFSDSPFAGEVVGYFNFSLFPLDCDDELFQPYRSQIVEFLRILTFGTRGTVTRLKTQYSVQSIVFEQCTLSSIFGKYGFNDGDALLDTDITSNYIVSLIEEIQNFLDKSGVGVNTVEGGAKVVYTDRTSHNPIRYSGHLSKESLQLHINLWIYNSVILQSKRLWNRRLED